MMEIMGNKLKCVDILGNTIEIMLKYLEINRNRLKHTGNMLICLEMK
jgi:hypothetical protein